MNTHRTSMYSVLTTAALAALLSQQAAQAGNESWDGGTGGTGTDWFTFDNWVSGTGFAGSQSDTANLDIATFTATGTGSPIGIDMSFAGNKLYLGAIDMTGNTARLIGNSSATAGTLVLNGATVNSVANTILRNTSTSLMTLQASQTGAMGLELGNATSNTIQITSSGGITIGSIISGVGKSLRLQGGSATTGALTLSGPNTYSGGTTLAGGVVAISNATSFGNSAGNVLVTGASRINTTQGNGVNLTFANAINVGAALTLQNPQSATGATSTFSGQLTGSNSITLVGGGGSGLKAEFAFTNANNTFTGNVIMPSGNVVGYDQFSFNSIGDGGNFTLQKTGNQNTIAYTGSSNIAFGTRTINIVAISGTFDGGGTNPVNMFANNGVGTVTFNANMTVGAIANANSTLFFGGSNTSDNTFAGIIPNKLSGAGTFGIGKTGAGKWILTGSNSYTGEVLVRNGTLSVNAIDIAANNQPLGKNLIIQLGHHSNTGTLEFTGGTNSTTDKQVRMGNTTAAQAGGAIILSNGTGSLTFSATTFNPTIAGITATRTLTLGGTNTGANEIQGVIQDNVASTGKVALTKTGSGTWTLSGPNTYSGGTTMGSSSSPNVGTLNITHGSALGTAAFSIVSNFGNSNFATLTLNSASGITVANNFSTSGEGAGNNGIIRNVTGNNVISGTMTLTSGGGNTRIGSDGGSLTLSNTIAPNATGRFLFLTGSATGEVSGAINNGAGANTLSGLTKEGAGTWTLSGTSNNYTGITSINGGILNVAALAAGGSNSSIGAAAVTNTNLLLNGGTLQYTGSAATGTTRIFSVGANGATFDASGTGVGTLSFTGITTIGYNSETTARTITLTGSNTGANTMSVIIGNNTGLTALTKSGAGNWVLNGANTYTGTTSVNEGTLQVSGGAAIANTGLVSIADVAGATFQVVGSEIIAALTGGGATGGAVSIDGSQTLTLSAGGGNTYAGTVSGSGALTLSAGNQTLSGVVSNSGGINVTGSGILTLGNSSNTYTGVTAIGAGAGRFVIVTDNGALGATGAGNETTIAGTAGATGPRLGFSGGINYSAMEKVVGAGSGDNRGFIQSFSGNNTFAGDIELSANGNSRIGSQNGAQLTLTGAITQGSGITTANILFRPGDNNGDFVTLSNTGNSFGGNSTVYTALATAGQYSGLRLGADNAHPTNLTVQNYSTSSGSSTALDLNGNDQTLNGLASGGAGTLNIINLKTGVGEESTLTLNPTSDRDSGTNITILGGSPGGTPLGVINVVKDGTSTQTLRGSNTYTGATTVSGGTLLINGAHTGGGLITVFGTATLGGSTGANPGGQIGSVDMAAGTFLRPGTGNILRDDNWMDVEDLTLTATTQLYFEFGDPDDGLGAKAANDLVTVHGALSTLGGVLNVIDLGTFTTASSLGSRWQIFAVPNTPFVPASFNLSLGTIPTRGDGLTYAIEAVTGSNAVYLKVVPEAGTAGLLALGLLLLRRLRRR